MTLIEFVVFFKDLAKSRRGKVQVTVIWHGVTQVLMSKRRAIRKDDLTSVLFMLILFVSVVGGRELGNFYSSYESLTDLKVVFDVEEEDLSRFLLDTLSGTETGLDVGYTISSKGVDNSVDIITTQPDYVRRWLIGVTVSPIRVNQPEASDVDFEMLVEDQLVDKDLYSFPREKINYLGLRDREINVDIDSVDDLREIVEESIIDYGGEVKVEFRGQVKVHLLFLDTWLPFEVTRHTLVRLPLIELTGSEWRSLEGTSIESLDVNQGGYVQVEVFNPTRIHSLREEYVCEFYKDGIDTPVNVVSKEVNVAPLTDGQYIFQFRFDEPGVYRYRLSSGDRVLIELDESTLLAVE